MSLLRTQVAAAREVAIRCVRRKGDPMDHLSTARVARDLDLLRQAVGDQQLTYDRFSYGPYLGASCAALFGETFARCSGGPDSLPPLVLDVTVK
jgi:hypothetical protein